MMGRTLYKLDEFNSSLPIEEAKMPPAHWYIDTDFHKLEQERIFKRTWQPVARISELTEANTYISGVTAGIPWVITRDEENKLHAFYNVCSHKGREVVRGRGCAKSCELTCGYHAWKFKLNGELKSAPQMAGIRNFDRANMGLIPLNVCEWGNWIFINGDADAKPFEQQVPELTEMLNKRKFGRLKFHSSKSWVINCNWKVYIDNYLDGGYHIPFMHPSLNEQLNMGSYSTVLFNRYNVQTSGATLKDEGVAGLGYDPKARIGDGSIYAWVYPNFMLNLYGDCLDTNYVVPKGTDQCEVFYEFYFLDTEGKAAEEFIEASIKQSDVTQIEDIEICESVQVGLKSGVYRPGRYAPSLEIGEYQFHQILKQDLESKILN